MGVFLLCYWMCVLHLRQIFQTPHLFTSPQHHPLSVSFVLLGTASAADGFSAEQSSLFCCWAKFGTEDPSNFETGETSAKPMSALCTHATRAFHIAGAFRTLSLAFRFLIHRCRSPQGTRNRDMGVSMSFRQLRTCADRLSTEHAQAG